MAGEDTERARPDRSQELVDDDELRLPAVPSSFMTSSEPLIRRASASDGDALGRLGALLVQQHHSFDQRRFLAPTPDTPEHYGAFLSSQLHAPDAVILVAESEGRP